MEQILTKLRSVLSFRGSLPGRISYDRTEGIADQRTEEDWPMSGSGPWFEVRALRLGPIQS